VELSILYEVHDMLQSPLAELDACAYGWIGVRVCYPVFDPGKPPVGLYRSRCGCEKVNWVSSRNGRKTI
jgi:hypothetical protein